MSRVILTVILLSVASAVGSLYLKQTAEEHARLGGSHAFFPTLVIFSGISALLCCCRGCCSFSGKHLDFMVRSLTWSLLIGSCTGWRMLPQDSYPLTREDGPIYSMESSADCSSGDTRTCTVSIDLKGKLGLQSGHSIRFAVKSKEGKVIPASVEVTKSETRVEYSADVVMPYFNLAHKMALDKKESDKYGDWKMGLSHNSDLWTMMSTGNGSIVGVGELNKDQVIPMTVEETDISALSEKWKCGHWTANSIKMKQIYAAIPSTAGGYIQWVPTSSSVLRLKFCLEVGKPLCHEQDFVANEAIRFETEDFILSIDRGVRPGVPVLPNLISRYTVQDGGKSLILDNWRSTHKAFRGTLSLYDLGSVQSSCVPTKESNCQLGHFPWSQVMSWSIQSTSQCVPEKQNGVITTILISVIAAAIITGASLGITDHYAKCNVCTVVQTGVTAPDWQDTQAGNYAPAEGLYLALDKHLPGNVTLTMKNGEAFAENVEFVLLDFEQAIADIDFRSSEGLIVKQSDGGTPTGITLSHCTVNLAGGLGECSAKITLTGEPGEFELYSKDGKTIVQSVVVHLNTGPNDLSLGISGEFRSDDHPEICVGDRILDMCGSAVAVDVNTNPDIKTNDPNKEVVGSKVDGNSWSLKDLWDLLSDWWNKLILVALIVVTVFLAVVCGVMIYRIVCAAMILKGWKDVNAEEIHIGRYEYQGQMMDLFYVKMESKDPKYGDRVLPNATYMEYAAANSWLTQGEKLNSFNYGIDKVHDNWWSWSNNKCRSKCGDVPSERLGNNLPLVATGTWGRNQPGGLEVQLDGRKEKFLRTRDALYAIMMDQHGCSSDAITGAMSNAPCTDFYMPTVMKTSMCESDTYMQFETKGWYRTVFNARQDSRGKEVSTRRRWVTGNKGVQMNAKGLKELKCGSHVVPGIFLDGGEVVPRTRDEQTPFDNSVTVELVCADDMIRNGTDKVYISGTDLSDTWHEQLKCLEPSCTGCGMITTEMKQKDIIANISGTFERIPIEDRVGSNWWESSVALDHRLNGNLVYRGITWGPYYYVNKEPFTVDPSVEYEVIVPLVFSPFNSAYKTPTLLLMMLNKGEMGDLHQSDKLSACQQLSRGVGSIEWEITEDGHTMMCHTKCKHCTFKGDKRTIHSYNSPAMIRGQPKQDSAGLCFFHDGTTIEAHEHGPFQAHCVCMGTLAYCVQESHTAVLVVKCRKETWGKTDMKVFRGTYRCGSTDQGLEFHDNKIRAIGDIVATNTSWKDKAVVFKADEVMNLLGNVRIYNNHGEESYMLWLATPKDCAGFMNQWKCAWDNHKGLILLLTCLPASFLIFFMLLCIMKACMRSYKAAKGARIGGAVAMVADSIVGKPQERARRKVVMSSWA